MSIKIDINSLGRIGKLVFRLLVESDEFELVAVNDPMPAHVLENLLKYDTIHGRFHKFKHQRDGEIFVGDKCVALSHKTSPATM